MQTMLKDTDKKHNSSRRRRRYNDSNQDLIITTIQNVGGRYTRQGYHMTSNIIAVPRVICKLMQIKRKDKFSWSIRDNNTLEVKVIRVSEEEDSSNE